jgi:hypothetical protein
LHSDGIPRDHYRGKRTLQRIIRDAIQAHGDEMPLEDLLNHLQKLGYDKESIRIRLRPLGVEVVGDMARLMG